MAQRRGALVGQSPAITFDGLVRLLLGRSPRYAGDFERSLLVSHLLTSDRPRPPGSPSGSPARSAVAGALLEQLGDSGRSPEQIDRALAEWASDDRSRRSSPPTSVRLLTATVPSATGWDCPTAPTPLREALAAVAGWTRPLALYGFTSFTLAQRRLVARPRPRPPRSSWSSTTNGRGAGRSPRRPSWPGGRRRPPGRSSWKPRRWLTLAGYRLSGAAFHGRRASPGASAARGPSDEGVRFLLASGQRNEAELAAEQVAGLIRSGLRPGQIAVVVRHMKTWGRLLEDVFASCGIPCQVDERLALGRDRAGPRLSHRAAGGGRGRSGGRPRVPAQPVQRRSRWSRRATWSWTTCAGPRAGWRRCWRCAERRSRGLRSPNSCGRSSARLEATCRRPRRRSGARPPHAREPASSGPRSAATCRLRRPADDARAFRALQKALSRPLRSAAGASLCLPATLRTDILLPALAGMAVPGGPLGSADAVQVLTAHRARARRFQAVLVLGLVGGRVPRARRAGRRC